LTNKQQQQQQKVNQQNMECRVVENQQGIKFNESMSSRIPFDLAQGSSAVSDWIERMKEEENKIQ
jgi:hypothetical protein